MSWDEVRDLPQLWQRPGYGTLLSAIRSLRVAPPTWDAVGTKKGVADEENEGSGLAERELYRKEAARYLSAVVGSELAWFDDEQRETLWTEASKALAERCGRTAMGEMTRSWSFDEQECGVSFELHIREPALTGDALGLKTWGSSYAMARILRRLGESSLSHLLPGDKSSPLSVLELGAGTGLLGLAAAVIWGASVVTTDLPDIVENLRFNVQKNLEVVLHHGGQIEGATLTWGGSDDAVDPRFRNQHTFQLILAADPLYDDSHPSLLASAINEQLSVNHDARAVVMVPLRDNTTRKLLEVFRRNMDELGCPVVGNDSSVVFGRDDWESRENCSDIESWYGTFGRSTSR